MEFESSIKTFDKLLEGTIGFRFLVEILQADDGVMLNARLFFVSLLVHEVDSSWIRWVPVGYESDFLIGIGCSDGFVHGDDGGFGFTGMREMVSGEDKVLGR